MALKNVNALSWVVRVCLIWLASAALPVAGQAQTQPIGVLTPGLTFGPALDGLKEGLERLGYRPDKELSFTIQDTKGSNSDLGEPIKKIIESRPSLLFAVTTVHALAAKKLAGELPMVFVWVSDPVKSGLTAGYGTSKSNATGILSYSVLLSGKRLEALKELVPGVKRVLALVAAKDGIAADSLKLAEPSAEKLRIEILRREVANREDIEQALAALPRGAVDAIYHVPSVLVSAHIDLLINKSKKKNCR